MLQEIAAQREMLIELSVDCREGYRMLDEAIALLREIKPSVPYARNAWHRRVEVVFEQTKFYPSNRLDNKAIKLDPKGVGR
jgi:hypothetical protein